MKFCVETWQKMPQKTKDQLTDTAQIFFHLLEQFANLKKTHGMNLLIKHYSKLNNFNLWLVSVIFLEKLI